MISETGQRSQASRNALKRVVAWLSRPLRRNRFFLALAEYEYHLKRLLRGAQTFRSTGRSPDEAYQSLVALHCRTQGYSNDMLAWLIKTRHRPVAFPNADGVLGNLTQPRLEQITNEVRENGYYIFPHLLEPDVCQRLTEFALSTECKPVSEAGILPPRIYHRERPVAETYRFSEQSLLDLPDVQKLIADYSILALAQSYVGVPPILDLIVMWWSTAFAREASSESAQLYHFDMDRIRWLKFFFYLTDVGPDNGPHCFVAKSHKRKGQPLHLLKRGYVRIPDADIETYYPADDIKEITGPRGTMFVADTRAFHKGKPVREGDRLILQFEFSNSLFGGAYTIGSLESHYDPHLLELAERYRRVYSKFNLKGNLPPTRPVLEPQAFKDQPLHRNDGDHE
jgi:hypothetical protein